MSDDELEKLAAEMQNIQPSADSRKEGMAAAMAAFDLEFASEISETTVKSEENIEATQGLGDAPRPTGQITDTGSVQTFGSDMMAKINNIFTFKPRTMMLAGSCMAALFAGMVIMPNISDLSIEDQLAKSSQSVSADVMTDEVITEPIVERLEQGTEVETAVPTPSMPNIAVENETPLLLGKDLGGINSISDLLNNATTDSVKAETDNKSKETKSRQIFVSGPVTQTEIENRSQRREQQLALLSNSQGAQPQFAPPTTPGHPVPPVIERQSASLTAVSSNAAQGVIVPSQSTQTQHTNGYVLEEVPAEYKLETKTIVTKEASTEVVTPPATFETVTETVVVTPAFVKYVRVEPEYDWVEGDIQGNTVEYVAQGPQYETIAEPVVVQEASTELVTIPAIYNPDGTIATPARTQERTIPSVTKLETRRVIKTPASTVERVVPYEKKNGKTRIPKGPVTYTEKIVPAVTKEVSRRVMRRPASVQERIIPAGVEREVQVRTIVNPQRFYLRDENGNVVREFASRDEFEKYQSNQATSVQEKPVSTFSVDVDTASYSFLRASINSGKLPPRSSIRLEELINYFPYDYEAPTSSDEPFKANVTVTPTPWNADTKLMHIGIKGYVPPADEKPRSNLVFLIDVSGSMKDAKKLPLLVNSFKLLLGTLDANDTVSIVTYAGSVRTALEPTRANEKDKIHDVLNSLSANGGTAGAAGLQLAYAKAEESFDEEGVNRVILATDGDFNIGFSSPDEIKSFIEEKRETGIFLSVLGFGMGNYKDNRMQALAQNGNGVAAYIDTLAEANKVLANEAGSALITIAKDVKIQVEFNPDTIAEYRLIGYETRALKRQDFNNDKVDAGEIGAGHSVTAIYELTPVGSPAITNDPLRYVTERLEQTTGSDEFAFVKIRHKLPNADKSTLQTFPIGKGHERRLKQASDDMRFAAAVAAVGQKIRGNAAVDDFNYQDAIKLAKRARGEDENGYRNEFIQLVRLIDSLEK